MSASEYTDKRYEMDFLLSLNEAVHQNGLIDDDIFKKAEKLIVKEMEKNGEWFHGSVYHSKSVGSGKKHF